MKIVMVDSALGACAVTWKRALGRRGHDVNIWTPRRVAMSSDRGLDHDGAVTLMFGLHLTSGRAPGAPTPLVWPQAPTSRPPRSTMLEAFRRLEACGIAQLSSCDATLAATFKSTTHEALVAAGVPHPPLLAWEETSFAADPLVVKPDGGWASAQVARAGALAQARAQASCAPMVLQRFVAGRCLRVISSRRRVLTAYAKDMPPGQWPHCIGAGGRRVPVAVDEELERLCLQAMQALDLGLAGLDVLAQDDGRLWLLEANPVFGFDDGDVPLADALAEETEWLLSS